MKTRISYQRALQLSSRFGGHQGPNDVPLAANLEVQLRRQRSVPPITVCLLLLSGAVLAEPPPKQVSQYSAPKVDKKLVAQYRALAGKRLCPKGLPFLQGTWKFIGQSRVPHFSDVITFDGARYTERISGGRPPRVEQGKLTGEIACLEKNRILIRVTKASPEGVFGNRSGEDYPCDVLTPVSVNVKDRVLLVCYVEWDLRTEKGLDLEFQKVVESPPTP